jgi:hypothetical protein
MQWSDGGQPDHLGFAAPRGGGKGGKQQSDTSSNSSSQTNLPPWLDTAAQQAVGMAQNLSQSPYTPYTGQIVAGTTADQNQAYQQVRDMQGSANPAFQASANAYSGLLGSAAPQTAAGLNQGTNTLFGNYQQSVMNPAQGLLGGYLQGGPATAQQAGANASALMNPYTQQVINPALQAGQQQLALANQGIAGQANNVGAFGGSRQGVQQGVAEAQTALGTQQQIGNMLTQGWNTASQQGTSLAEQAAQQGLTAGQYLGNLGQSGYQNAQNAGQTMANTNLQAGLTAAANAPTQAVQQANLAQQQAGALQASGVAQQQQQQAIDNAAMGQFYQQQQQPYQNLDTLLSAVGAVPYGTSGISTGTGQTTQTTTPGLLDQITGAVGMAGKVASIAGQV